ncbi:MAG: hypothetical protein AB1657_01380 [Candidatus Micrarchaeota archaeon]
MRSEPVSRFQFPVSSLAILPAALLLLAGCVQQAQPPAPQPEPPDYSYDLLVKDISTLPRNVYIGDDYTVMVYVQRYGRYAPAAYRLRVFDSDQTLYDGVVDTPGLMEAFSFNYTGAGEEPRNIRAYVESYDLLHPEPESALPNNFMQKTIRPQPLGYYGECYACMHLYYDAVNYVMRQAQAFTHGRSFTVHRVGMYLRSSTDIPGTAPVIVEIRRDNGGKPGEPIASSSIAGAEVGAEPGWHYAYFQNLTLPAGKYWIVARLDSTDGYGVQWARAEGNPYGEMYDTMVMDLMDWPEWDYKLFDFVFQIY